jgi:hypothetical protein
MLDNLESREKIVTPVKTGVQKGLNFLISLDSGFRRNDERKPFPPPYEAVVFEAWKIIIRQA